MPSDILHKDTRDTPSTSGTVSISIIISVFPAFDDSAPANAKFVGAKRRSGFLVGAGGAL